MTRRQRDELFRDTREALRFAQRAFNDRRYDEAASWAYTAEAKANTLQIAAKQEGAREAAAVQASSSGVIITRHGEVEVIRESRSSDAQDVR